MKQLTPEQIQENWSKLRGIINDTFVGERLDNLNKMYDYFDVAPLAFDIENDAISEFWMAYVVSDF